MLCVYHAATSNSTTSKETGFGTASSTIISTAATTTTATTTSMNSSISTSTASAALSSTDFESLVSKKLESHDDTREWEGHKRARDMEKKLTFAEKRKLHYQKMHHK